MKEQNEDQLFRELMAKSRQEMPFPGLEENVMMEIGELEARQERLSRNMKLSWIFFTAGAVFGILLSVLLPQLPESMLGIYADGFVISLQIGIVLVLLLQLESLIKSTHAISLESIYRKDR